MSLTVSDIAENPHKYQFKQIDDTTGSRILNSVDAVIISNSVDFDGGLNGVKDSIYHETINKNTRYNINIIATAKKQRIQKTRQTLPFKRNSRIRRQKVRSYESRGQKAGFLFEIKNRYEKASSPNQQFGKNALFII